MNWITLCAAALFLGSGTWMGLYDCWIYLKTWRENVDITYLEASSLQLRTLGSRPTLAAGQCCDLKLETANGERWWVCRLNPGHTDHRVTKEEYQQDGTYITTEIYRDKKED